MAIDSSVEKLVHYMYLGNEPKESDVIIGMGSIDRCVGEYAVKLMKEGFGKQLLFTGGHGKAANNEKPEAEIFGEIALRAEIDPDRLIIENKATNTGDNIRFAVAELEKRGVDPSSMLVVTKPYGERRVNATFEKSLGGTEIDVTVVSPRLAAETLFCEHIPRELAINLMVGDVQRLQIYPGIGYTTEQDMPDDVIQAYEELVANGYDKYLKDLAA